MKVVKHINNNFAIAEDSQGKQCIISGRGIGFGVLPREISLEQISRTYYEVDPIYISMIESLPDDIIGISSRIVGYARTTIDKPLNASIVFTLADHINFCIERYRKKMNIKLPIINDIQYLFEKEMKVGQYGLRLIRKERKIFLPKEEAAYIALHIINAEENGKPKKSLDDDEIVEGTIKIIEADYGISVNREDFNCSRFVTHLHYLLKRGRDNTLYVTENIKIFQTTKDDYPQSYECAEKVSAYLHEHAELNLTDEEKLYLMLHINRLCTREACNQ